MCQFLMSSRYFLNDGDLGRKGEISWMGNLLKTLFFPHSRADVCVSGEIL